MSIGTKIVLKAILGILKIECNKEYSFYFIFVTTHTFAILGTGDFTWYVS